MTTHGTIDVTECVAEPDTNVVHFVARIKRRRDFLDITQRTGALKIHTTHYEMCGGDLTQIVTGDYTFVPDRWYATCDALHQEARIARKQRKVADRVIQKGIKRAYRKRGWDYPEGGMAKKRRD